MRGSNRREWAAELRTLAEEFDDLTDDAAENAIRELVEKELGQGDYLMALDLGRARKQRLAGRRNAKEPTGGKLDLSDLIPSRTFTANPSAGPPLKKSHPLGNRNLVSRKHQ